MAQWWPTAWAARCTSDLLHPWAARCRGDFQQPPAAPPAGTRLWLSAACYNAGGWSEAAAGLRTALKEAAGKLMGQLHDRNCRRAFAPAQAFQADALPPDRFHSEMQASKGGGLASCCWVGCGGVVGRRRVVLEGGGGGVLTCLSL